MSNRVPALRTTDIDLIRELSEIAKTTRRPGQTLQSRLNELRRSHELVVPLDVIGTSMSGGAAL